MKIVYGVTQPDAGDIEWEGQPVAIAGPAAARQLGIGMVFQHFSLFETLTVAENIALALRRARDAAAFAARIAKCRSEYGLPWILRACVHSCRSASASASRSCAACCRARSS